MIRDKFVFNFIRNCKSINVALFMDSGHNNLLKGERRENGNLSNNLEKFIIESAFHSYNFNEIPPIFGCLVADQHGNTLMVFEYDSKDKNNYRPIKSYLSDHEKSLLEIDLISMYFSSFKAFAGQTNIQNLSNLEIHGSNIKVQIFFLFNKYMIIFFLNSNTDLSLKKKKHIIEYFEEKITKFEFEFTHFNAAKSRKILSMLENKGKAWLKQLNKNYLQTYSDSYLKKHEIINELSRQVEPIIEKILNEYLENIEEDIVNNVSKEIKNQIQDKLFGFDPNSL
jgi:hypothetical protein